AEGSLTTSAEGELLGYVHQFFQVLNDEMILRAACLTLVLRVFPYPKTVVLGAAVLFSAGHHLVYRMNGVFIDWPAMVTLFSFGAIANLLFVRFGHIGYGVALHYAWNFYRFNSVYALDGHPLNEGLTFNYVEGNVWVVTGSMVALVLTFLASGWSDGPWSVGSRVVLGDAAKHQRAGDQKEHRSVLSGC
ncbi:MAG: CPBP family intramembrane glutamic endopeptidase, partial [Polyangiales bacterium]